jgi:hypothetical protein
MLVGVRSAFSPTRTEPVRNPKLDACGIKIQIPKKNCTTLRSTQVDPLDWPQAANQEPWLRLSRDLQIRKKSRLSKSARDWPSHGNTSTEVRWPEASWHLSDAICVKPEALMTDPV